MNAVIPRTALSLALFSATAFAQVDPTTRPTPAGGDYVTREDYDKLKREQDELRSELEAMKRERAGFVPATTAPAPLAGPGHAPPSASQADLDAANESIREIKDDISRYHTADSRFTIVGDATFSYVSQKSSPSTFSTVISPLALWEPTDRILVEAAADISVATDDTNNSTTSVDLNIGNVSYLVNDYLAVGAGLFVVPFGQFHNHFDPPWINEFPDDPLAFDAIAPDSEVGAFAKGAVPLTVAGNGMKFTYDLYLANGPNLITNDTTAAGSLNFSDFTDLNNNKAIGGRIGFLPAPNMEFGYSLQTSKPGAGSFEHLSALLQAVDFNWRQDVDAFSGWIDLRGEYTLSHVGRATYDPPGAPGPFTFTNNREGGYVQLGYRPAYVENHILRNFEFAARYDFLNTPLSSPGGDDEHRFALGVDYWITPQTVFETAYEFDRRKQNPSTSGLLIQLGLRL